MLETLENPSEEVKRDVIRLLVDHIVVEDDAMIIHHIVPITENGRLSLKHIFDGRRIHSVCELERNSSG